MTASLPPPPVALQITKVEIKNIKNHAEAVFDFNPGVTAICGPNGAGKTTIIEAIAWALFDHLEYNRDDFVRRGAKRGQVDISFRSNLDDREYLVHRDTGGGYFVFDVDTKVKLVEQKNQVVGWLKQHIGVEPTTDLSTLFKTTIGVPQGTFTTDFAQSAALRKKTFDQILQVEEYREASDNLKETQRHLQGRITETDRKIAEAEGELKGYDEIKQHADELTARLQTLEQQLAHTTHERDQAEQRAREFAELAEQIARQRGIVERTNIKLQLTRGNLSTAKEAAEQARQADDIIGRSRTGYEQYSSASQRLTELERQRASRDALRTRANKIEQEFVTAKVQSERAKERLQEVQQAKTEIAGLAAAVQEQQTLETRLAELRESRGQAQGLQHAAATLDRELERLRGRFGELKNLLKEAEAYRQDATQIDSLEAQLRSLTEQFTAQEVARQSAQIKRDQLAQAKNEAARLQAEQTKLNSEITRLQPLVKQVAKLAQNESELQTQTQTLAMLRAEIARDSEMISALESGGICPLLTEKCLNLKPGESFDKRFKSGLEKRRLEIARLEKTTVQLTAESKTLRNAEAEVKRLPKLQEELQSLAERSQKQQGLVAKLEAETARVNGFSETQLKQLQQQRQTVDAQLRQAREAQTKIKQAEMLLSEYHNIKTEGESKRSEREALQQQLAALADITDQLAQTETRLQALGDPRSRAAMLKQIIQRETEWQQAAQKAEQQSEQINAQLAAVNAELQAFADLDRALTEATAARIANEAAYQAFIANEKIASTLTAREAEANLLAAELATTESALNAETAQLVAWEDKYDQDEHSRAFAAFNQLRERITQLTTQLEHQREQHDKLQTQLAHLNEVREQMRQDAATHDKLSRLRTTTEFIRDTLQKAAPYITEAYLHSVSIEANQFFREITGRYDVSLKWSNDYEITLEERGYERPFANLSGGEQMAAALAVRLALLKEFSDNLSLAFFDEPTTNMDEDRRRNLAQQIGRVTGFRQLFVISHDDSFENFTDQVITLGERG
ncbi:MAG: SMC family ATPase [Blastocatellia bacterium]